MAIVWLYGTQIAFDERLAFFVNGSAERPGATPHLLIICAFSAGLALTRWDATPRSFKWFAPVTSALAILLALPLYHLGIEDTAINGLLVLMLGLGAAGIMASWYEVLAKLDSITKSLMAVLIGWFLFYVLRLLLSLFNDVATVVIVACLPLALLLEAPRPLAETENAVPFFPRQVVGLPILRLALVGIAGGLALAAERMSPSYLEASVFMRPEPLFMFLTGAYLLLAVQSAAAHRYLKAAFFFTANLLWDITSLIGLAFRELAPAVSDPILTAVAYVAFFAAFATFLIRPPASARQHEERGAPDHEYREIAESRGLTKREIEVLCLLLHGRNVPYIQERLTISEGTARSHVNNIYKKLDVHSRQDLLDLFVVEGSSGDGLEATPGV